MADSIMHYLRTLKTIFTVAGAFGVLSLAPVTSAHGAQWNFAEPYGDANFHTQNARQFAEDVTEATGGKLAVTVHANGALIPHPEIKNAVRRGIVPVGELFLSRLANENPIFEVDALPTLANDYESARRLWQASKPEISKRLERQGLKVLYSVPWPSQGIYTQFELTQANQLQGIKLRSNNTATERLAKRLGAIPTQTEASDIPTAFSTGRVDAMVTSVSTGVNTAAWDYVSHFNDANLWLPKNIVIINQKAFDRLDKTTQRAVMDAAQKAEQRGWAMSKAESESDMTALKDHGIKVNTPTPALEKALERAGAELVERWKAQTGSEGEAILERYRQLSARDDNA
ncbi:TRAP transporter substrate-binding protein [Larsenimonas salina]|uniref:TRAP transporter substrate-binding protein n=1 Tax=Larsenimonas salina TaxID=1295565 RepID=UPI002073E464|nr:TRAP transporter substrate-binding protein [Larsenimonas salina]MCM5703758.1 TRAP transporter substrate-binding protein [Larsenimonas salina]